MVVAILLTVAGSLAVAAPTQWRNGRWLASGRWVAGRISPPAVAGAPAAGVMVASIGWMLVWPPLFLVAFGAALWWLWRMRASARERGSDLPESLRPDEPVRRGTVPPAASRRLAAVRGTSARGTHRRGSGRSDEPGRRTG
jgi:hypothetical protein